MTTFPGKLRGTVDERDSVGVDRDLVRTMTNVRSNTQTEPALDWPHESVCCTRLLALRLGLVPHSIIIYKVYHENNEVN